MSVQRARVIAEPSTVDVVLRVAEDLPEIQGDPVQLERVIHNLLDNAVYHSPEAGTVVVSAENTGSRITVSVIDAGPGVPAGYREHIFDRFARLQNTGRGRSGFGLGLYASRQIVRGHGGQIWVEPGPDGQGSRFVFTLPV
jgi:signal transduction histidine kinase